MTPLFFKKGENRWKFPIKLSIDFINPHKLHCSKFDCDNKFEISQNSTIFQWTITITNDEPMRQLQCPVSYYRVFILLIIVVWNADTPIQPILFYSCILFYVFYPMTPNINFWCLLCPAHDSETLTISICDCIVSLCS